MQAAKMIREDFLHQNAFDDRDTYTSLPKQQRLLSAILLYYEEARKALKEGVTLDTLLKMDITRRCRPCEAHSGGEPGAVCCPGEEDIPMPSARCRGDEVNQRCQV